MDKLLHIDPVALMIMGDRRFCYQAELHPPILSKLADKW